MSTDGLATEERHPTRHLSHHPVCVATRAPIRHPHDSFIFVSPTAVDCHLPSEDILFLGGGGASSSESDRVRSTQMGSFFFFSGEVFSSVTFTSSGGEGRGRGVEIGSKFLF